MNDYLFHLALGQSITNIFGRVNNQISAQSEIRVEMSVSKAVHIPVFNQTKTQVKISTESQLEHMYRRCYDSHV